MNGLGWFQDRVDRAMALRNRALSFDPKDQLSALECVELNEILDRFLGLMPRLIHLWAAVDAARTPGTEWLHDTPDDAILRAVDALNVAASGEVDRVP